MRASTFGRGKVSLPAMIENLQFVTGNKNKLIEAGQILGVELKLADPHIVIEEIQTISVDEAVRHKAKEAYKLIGAPLLVEDSGLVFNAWNGLPGALIKWFEKSVGNDGLLKMLSSEEGDRRSAVAQCYIGYHNGTDVTVAKGEANGRISNEVRGDNGFGWDSIFIPDGYDATYAEMSRAEKNGISHRKRAYEKLKELLSL